MNKQKGFAFLSFLLANWQLIALGLLIATAYGFYLHCQSVKERFETFKAEVKVKGEEQERLTRETIARNQKEKERADAENKRLRTSNASLSRSLRESRSSRGVLSGVPAPAKRPDLVCFSREEYERAFRRLDEGVSRIAEECDARTVDLDTAKRWAQAVEQ